MVQKCESRLATINRLVERSAKRVLDAHKAALSLLQKPTALESIVIPLKSLEEEEEARIVDEEVIETIALCSPTSSQLRQLIAYIKLVEEILRIGRYAKSYAKNITPHLEVDRSLFPLSLYIQQLHESAIEAFKRALEILESEDETHMETLARKAKVEESKTDEIFTMLKEELTTQPSTKNERLMESLHLLFACRKLERTADRAAKIAHLAILAKRGEKLANFQ